MASLKKATFYSNNKIGMLIHSYEHTLPCAHRLNELGKNYEEIKGWKGIKSV